MCFECACSHAHQARLQRMKEQIAKNISDWNHEIVGRKKVADQKKQFHDFLEKQLQRQKEIELEVKGDMGEEEEQRLKARNAFTKLSTHPWSSEHVGHVQQRTSTSQKSWQRPWNLRLQKKNAMMTHSDALVLNWTRWILPKWFKHAYNKMRFGGIY